MRVFQEMFQRAFLGFLLLSLPSVVGCVTGEPASPSPLLDVNATPYPLGDWYTPEVTATWQWQVSGDVKTEYDVDVYVIDLFDATEAFVSNLQNDSREVICQFSAGALEGDPPDANDFDNNVIGELVEGRDAAWWLDIRTETVVNLMLERLDLAETLGCDGVEPSHLEGYRYDSGFGLTQADQLAFNKLMANQAHARGLTVGLTVGPLETFLPDIDSDGVLESELVGFFDFALNAQCHLLDECDLLLPFITAEKPVFNAEFVESEVDAQAIESGVCRDSSLLDFRTLILPSTLDGSFRVSCD